MKPYPSYKDSGVEWIGEIPVHWKARKLKYEAYVEMGQSPSSEDYNLKNNGLPFLQGNADFTELYPIPRIWCDTANKMAKDGDILLSVRAPIGAVNIADQKYGIGRGLCAIHSVSTYQKYLYYTALSLHDELNSIGTGSTYTAISVDDLRNVFVPQSPTPEQKQIVSFLDHKTQKIDELIGKTEQKIELVKEKRTSLINHCVTKGLNPEVEMKDSGVEWIGEIPSSWSVIPIKMFGNVTLGKMLTSVDKGGYHLKPYLRSQNIQIEKVDISDVKKMWFSDSELEKLRLERGDLLFNEGGDVGRTSIWNNELDECYIQNSVNRVRFRKDNQNYFFYLSTLYHSVGYYDSIVNRVSIPHLTKEKLESVRFLRPPLKEQQHIVEYLDEQTQEIDNLIDKETQRIELLKEYRQSLISEVVTGKVDVRDWKN